MQYKGLMALWGLGAYLIFLGIKSPLQIYQLFLNLQKGSYDNFNLMGKDKAEVLQKIIKFFSTQSHLISTILIANHLHYFFFWHCYLKPLFGYLCTNTWSKVTKCSVAFPTSWKALESLLVLLFLPQTRLTEVVFLKLDFILRTAWSTSCCIIHAA